MQIIHLQRQTAAPAVSITASIQDANRASLSGREFFARQAVYGGTLRQVTRRMERANALIWVVVVGSPQANGS